MWLEILLVVVLLLVYAVIRDRKPTNCPPGPTEIPFIGNMPFVDEATGEKLRKKYGDIVMNRTGAFRQVYIFDCNVARDAMARPEYVDRTPFFESISIDDKKLGGVIGSNGAHWQHDRRFVLRNLRNLGMGKTYLEEAINIEAKALVEDLKKYNGEAINYPDSFRTASLNIVWQMVASHRYEMRSKEVDSIYARTKAFQENFNLWEFLPMFFPSLNRLPSFLLKLITGETRFTQLLDEIRVIVEETVNKHLEDFDPDNPRDLIDEYIKEMKESEGDENSLFRRGALHQIVNDLFQAGSDTVNNMMRWVVFLLARHPDCTQRMQKQIDEVVPKDHMVSLDDKPNLPLVEAFTVEALRYSSLLNYNVQRKTTKDTTLGGYFIPKDTQVTVANYSIHHDPRYWDDPHRFYPERFLDESGTKFASPKQAFFAFGGGRRQCVGEVLARMELFLFTAAVVQSFDFAPGAGADLSEIVCHNMGGFRLPTDHKLVYTPRML